MIRDIIFQRNFFKFAYLVLHWHIRYFMGSNTLPLACGFYITSKCNFHCEFCNIRRIQPGFQISKLEAQKLIREMGKAGLIYFSFSGGEPLLVPYIFDLLAYAKETGIIYTHLVSNGYLMDEDRARELAKARASEISFSLDGDEKFHDDVRGMKGSFKKVIEAVHLVKKYAPRTKVVLNTILDTVHPENAIFAVKKAESLKVKIKIQPLNNHPSFEIDECAVKSKRSLSVHEKQKLLEAIGLIQKSHYVVNSRPFLENYKAFMFSPEKLIFAKDDCIFGQHHMEVFASQVFPCLEGLDWRNGFDISKEPVSSVLKSHAYREKLQELKKCQYCKSKNYYICYYEPRINFPVWNFVKSRLKMPKNADA